MRSATLWRYQLPLQSGVILREQHLPVREGMLIQLQNGGLQGWGEAAPLAGFSQECLSDVQAALIPWLSGWCQGHDVRLPYFPSAAFGLSCALAELDQTLPAPGCYRSAMLASGDADDLLSRLAAETSPLAKIKVGLYEPVRDGAVVNMLLSALPALHLRLDANARWNRQQAGQFARCISPLNRERIDFIEEPCQDPDDSLAFAVSEGIAIAWDETLRRDIRYLRPENGVAAVVIKPGLTGPLNLVVGLCRQAVQCGLTPVISSALESSLGLTQLARIAHWLTPGIVPGLDTLHLMREQLVRCWPGSRLPLTDSDQLECLWHS